MKYRTILIDPPYPQKQIGKFKKTRNNRPAVLPYPTMTTDEIKGLKIGELAEASCHLWLWTTDQFLELGFELVRSWGFKFMKPIHWIKPSGLGAWWVSRTQTLLFAYRGKLDMKTKLHPNVLFAPATRHSKKPEESYQLIEAVSHCPRVELFAREARENWTSLGNEIDGQDIKQLL